MEWLLAHAPGFDQLSTEERSAINDFALLWALFEARILNGAGSATAICSAVDAWAQAGTLDAGVFASELAYFRDRYFANGTFTYHFDHLHLRQNDRQPLVRAVLDGSDLDPRHETACIFIIILRFRNNLFHGVKWQYRLTGQRDNFLSANSALIKALERHGGLGES